MKPRHYTLLSIVVLVCVLAYAIKWYHSAPKNVELVSSIQSSSEMPKTVMPTTISGDGQSEKDKKKALEIAALTAEWHQADPNAALAAKLVGLYILWDKRAGASAKRSSDALTILAQPDEAGSRLKLYQYLHIAIIREMMREPSIEPLLRPILSRPETVESERLAETRWTNSICYDYPAFLPKRVLDSVLQPGFEIESELLELEKQFPAEFVAWYSDAIRAGLLWYISDEYIKNNKPQSLKAAEQEAAKTSSSSKH